MFKKDFFLNLHFFKFYEGVEIPLFDDVYLHICSNPCNVYIGHKKYLCYSVSFGVIPEDDVRSNYTPVFAASVLVGNRQIKIQKIDYILDSELVVANLKYFPISPAWLLPVTNYKKWLNRCTLSLREYRKADYI